MWGFKKKGGRGRRSVGEKKEKQWLQCRHPVHEGSPCNSLRLSHQMRRTFYIHILEKKKKKVNWTSCRGTRSVLQQRDSPLNSLMIVLQVEKKARKIFSKGPVVMQHAKRGQRNFPSVIKIHNCAPFSAWYASIMRWAACWKTEHMHFISRLLLTAWETTAFLCMFIYADVFQCAFSHKEGCENQTHSCLCMSLYEFLWVFVWVF